MRYDLTRCNNLRWRIGNNEGFIKTAEGRVCVLSDKLWLSDRGRLEHRQAAEFGLDRAETWLDEHPEFEIIPRDPETYKDWQVGDVVVGEDGYSLTVEARLDNVVFLSWTSSGQICASDTYYICDEMYRCGYRLVLTDYEQEIAEAKAPECPLEKGDRVLVRDRDNDCWRFERFKAFKPKLAYPYVTGEFGDNKYKQCIPYNEKTWKLLGTADDYKEEITETNKTEEE